MKGLLLIAFVAISFTSGQSQAESRFGVGLVVEDCDQYRDQDLMLHIECIRRVSEARKAYAAQQSRYQNSPTHGSMSYQRCVLDKAPGAQNDLAAKAVIVECRSHPFYAREKKADFFGPGTARECFGKLGGKTQSIFAAKLIAKSCLELYPGTIY